MRCTTHSCTHCNGVCDMAPMCGCETLHGVRVHVCFFFFCCFASVPFLCDVVANSTRTTGTDTRNLGTSTNNTVQRFYSLYEWCSTTAPRIWSKTHVECSRVCVCVFTIFVHSVWKYCKHTSYINSSVYSFSRALCTEHCRAFSLLWIW